MKSAPLTFDCPAAGLTFDDRPAPAPSALPEARRITGRPTAKRYRDLRGDPDAVRALICPLPKPGECVHILLDGRFILAAAIPVILDTIGPAGLICGTLGMGIPPAQMIAELMQAGMVKRCTVVLSQFFSQQDRATCAQVCEILRAAGATVIIARSHCKVLMFAPAGPARYVCEGSSNLRSSVNLEQMTWSDDPQLYDFHAKWISELKSLDNEPAT